MSDYLLQEDGTSKFILEDASGDLLEESAGTSVAPPFIASTSTLYAPSVAYTGSVSFSTAGTYPWTPPPGVTAVTVEATGAGGGGGGTGGNNGGGGGGGGAYAKRTSVPVTPGTVYTFVVGAGSNPTTSGGGGVDGGDSSFTGDASIQVLAKGGGHATGTNDDSGGSGGQAASSVGDPGAVFSGGNGGNGSNSANAGAGGGGASGNPAGTGANGSDRSATAGGAGGVGANGGGSGGSGGDYLTDNATAGSSPGGGGGGAGGFQTGRKGADGKITVTPALVLNFIPSATTLYQAHTNPGTVTPPFIGTATLVYTPALPIQVTPPFIASATVVYTQDLPEVRVPFISSSTHVWSIFSTFDPNRTYGGPGNGGEAFVIELAANGTSVTATLAADITAAARALTLNSDTGMPTDTPFVVTLDAEVILLSRTTDGSYQIRLRGLSNTDASSHTAGTDVTWGDSYDQAIRAGSDIAHSFTADITSSGSETYDGWLICFDSSQAYLGGDRYPMHVTQVLGVFDAGAGLTGSNRCDSAQPNAISTANRVSDDCPAALSNPALITTDIATGDVAVVRYTNPEATALDLGPRSVALQSWFGLKRVDASDVDVTFTDPDGYVIDTNVSGAGPGPFTGSVNGEWADPIPLVTGIAPDASDALGSEVDTPNPVPYTTVTLDHTDRNFTIADEKGWPICCLAVRQGNRRIPAWQSWDWRDYDYVYSGFGTDATFCQLLINRNGIVFGSVPEVALPGDQDIDGPDAVWDDATYDVGASWYVALFGTPYLVFGPSIGGTTPPGTGGGGGGFAPGVTFPPGGGPVITVPPVEGGSGGGISQPVVGLHIWETA